MIKVAWFAASFVGRNASGTAQTAKKIITYLLNDSRLSIELTLLVKNPLELNLLIKDKSLSGYKTEMLPQVKGKIFKSSRQYYKYCFQNKEVKFDILHFSVPRLYPFFWKFPAKKFVCTFHAGGEISVPTDAFILSRHIYNFLMKIQWRKLSAIYADSDFGKKEISQYYKIPLHQITKIYLGADDLWNIKEKKITKINKNNTIILIVGRWQKYKNLHTILDAINNTKITEIREAKIIVLGKSDKLGKNLFLESIARFKNRNDRLVLIEYLEVNNLKYLYNNVDIVIHPSINEGFGIPAFEAFGEGAKIIVHKGTPADNYLSKFHGVFSGDLLDHKIIESLIVKAKKVPKQNKLKRRATLEQLGMTWRQLGIKTVESYQLIFQKY